ncbi:hypothetical protein POSPLADRAFT_1145291, partial [Postia placenta MAD-698-R-SB12]
IPRTVCWTLEQCREFRSGTFFTQGFVTAELGELNLCRGGIIKIAKTAFECCEEIFESCKGCHTPLHPNRSPCQEGSLGMILLVAGGTEDGPGVVVTVCQANFGRNKCLSSLTVAMVVEATEEVQWRGDVQ